MSWPHPGGTLNHRKEMKLLNIFYLDNDPDVCAEQTLNKHVVKMPLESCQLLQTAHIYSHHKTPYDTGKKGWVNHPCALWVRTSEANYLWLCDLAEALMKEYTYRYGKVHKYDSEQRVQYYRENVGTLYLPKIGFTTPYLAMPDECKRDSAIESYREYYRACKSGFAEWGPRPVPSWFAGHKESA